MVAENQFLIPTTRKKAFCPSNKYLIVALDTSEVEEGASVDPASAVESLKKLMVTKLESNEKQIAKVEGDVRAMRAEFRHQLRNLLGDSEAPSATQQMASAVKSNILGKLGQSVKPE